MYTVTNNLKIFSFGLCVCKVDLDPVWNQTQGFISNEKKELEPGSESLLRSKNWTTHKLKSV
jgi:hypothetical protein